MLWLWHVCHSFQWHRLWQPRQSYFQQVALNPIIVMSWSISEWFYWNHMNQSHGLTNINLSGSGWPFVNWRQSFRTTTWDVQLTVDTAEWVAWYIQQFGQYYIIIIIIIIPSKLLHSYAKCSIPCLSLSVCYKVHSCSKQDSRPLVTRANADSILTEVDGVRISRTMSKRWSRRNNWLIAKLTPSIPKTGDILKWAYLVKFMSWIESELRWSNHNRDSLTDTKKK